MSIEAGTVERDRWLDRWANIGKITMPSFLLSYISALLLNLEIQVQLPAIFSGIHEGGQQQSKYLFSSKVRITNQDLNLTL